MSRTAATFLVELFVEHGSSDELEQWERRARGAADELTAEGTPTRYVRSLYLPEDETCFYVFQACSADAVTAACRRAGIAYERIVAAVDTSLGQSTPKELP